MKKRNVNIDPLTKQRLECMAVMLAADLHSQCEVIGEPWPYSHMLEYFTERLGKNIRLWDMKIEEKKRFDDKFDSMKDVEDNYE